MVLGPLSFQSIRSCDSNAPAMVFQCYEFDSVVVTTIGVKHTCSELDKFLMGRLTKRWLMGSRHCGHVGFVFFHVSMHSLQYVCPHDAEKGSLKGSVQIGHSKFASIGESKY